VKLTSNECMIVYDVHGELSIHFNSLSLCVMQHSINFLFLKIYHVRYFCYFNFCF